MKKYQIIFSLIIIALLLMGCSQNDSQTNVPVISEPTAKEFIRPLFADFDVPFETYQVNSDAGDVLDLGEGSRLIIPAGAFADGNQPVKGEVEIRFRFFHDALDAILAGIPMYFGTSDTTIMEHFVTAGSFEVRAYQGDKELQLTQGKSLDIEYATDHGDDDYDFFHLDEEEKRWRYQGDGLVQENPEMSKLQQARQAANKKIRNNPFANDYFALNQDWALDVFVQNDYNKIKSKVIRDLFQKKAADYNLQYLDIDTWELIDYQGKQHYAGQFIWTKTDGNFQKPYRYFDIVTINENTFCFNQKESYDSKIIINKVKMRLEMPLWDIFNFDPKIYKEEYLAYQKEMIELEKKTTTIKNYIRTAKISRLGICNWDSFLSLPAGMPVAADFKTPDSLTLYNIYYVLKSQRSIVTLALDSANMAQIKIQPGMKAFFLAATPSGTVYQFSSDEYQAINFDSLKQIDNPRINIVLDETFEVKNYEEFRDIAG